MFLIVLVIVLVLAFAALMFARDLNEILGRRTKANTPRNREKAIR